MFNNQQQPSTSPLHIWFLLVDTNGQPYKGTSASAVSLPPNSVVDQFRKAVNAANPNKLSSVDASDLMVYKNKSAFEMKEDALEEDSLVAGFGISKKEALFVIVRAPAAHDLRPHRQVRYKGMSVEDSCRMYLDALAGKIATFYNFKHKFTTGATIGDVVDALVIGEDKKARWSFIREVVSYEQVDENGNIRQINEGDPKLNIPLPSLYTADEWDKLKRFNRFITPRVHSAALPCNAKGKPYVIIPHEEYILPGVVDFFKNIGVKALLISSPNDLEVKDEDVISECPSGSGLHNVTK